MFQDVWISLRNESLCYFEGGRLYLKYECGVHPVDVVGTDGVVVDEKVKWNWECNVEQRRTTKDHAWKKINVWN